MREQTLNGIWNYRIGKGKQTQIEVPFSKLAVGHSECSLDFDLQDTADKTFLKFEGITYYAKVFLNDFLIGEIGPYCEYTFDISDKIKKTGNSLLVEIEDISPEFGPSEGWENYGGIIRDVKLLFVNENYIKDVFFHTNLLNEYNDAEFTVEIQTGNSKGGILIQLFYEGKEVYRQKSDSIEPVLSGKINNVRLWSPKSPQLYELKVSITDNNTITDTYSCMAGFREFKCTRHRFLLNGEPIFLKGVCKHEMFGDSGHCPTEEQMRTDMEMIKSTGCNFVRLVHYPHNKKILDIADEIGLMVSEEPGLWWSDTSNPAVSDGSLEVLRRTILRDKNHPCIVFWLCFNECIFTEQYLTDSAAVCRKLDPTRLVSGANCMSNEDTLKYYNICGFDFYTMHPYSQTIDRAKETAKILHDKPLLFTEWGGHYVYNNPKLLGEFMDEMYALYLADSDEGALAGAFYWEWSELNDYNRGEPACIDGNLCEGLVDKYRNPNSTYEAFCNALKRMENPNTYPFWIKKSDNANFDSVNICSSNLQNKDKFRRIIREINENQNNAFLRKRILTTGPVLEDAGSLLKTPLVIDDGDSIELNCDATSEKITITGMVSLTEGYPLSGEYGEKVAEITLCFKDGNEQKTVFCNGTDVTTVFELYRSSKINPVAENSPRVATFGYDKNFESYVLNIAEIPVNKNVPIEKIRIESKNNGYALLIYGISV